MSETTHVYWQAFRGQFWGVRHWHQLDTIWRYVTTSNEAWYVYAVGEIPPNQALSGTQLNTVISELDTLLHTDHDEDYCGIVYVDSLTEPSFIKVFDPNNLGSVCGSSGNPPLPGWIISKTAPINLPEAMPQTKQRRTWWQTLFHRPA